MTGELVSFEVMRTVLREIAMENSIFEGGRVRFIDRSDDPNDPWIKLTAGPYEPPTQEYNTARYIKWIFWATALADVASPDDGWVQEFKADLLEILRETRYRPHDQPTWTNVFM